MTGVVAFFRPRVLVSLSEAVKRVFQVLFRHLGDKHLMKSITAVLDNGTSLELVRHARADVAIFGVRWLDGQGRSLAFFADRCELTLRLAASHQAFESAAQAGSAIERLYPAAPFALYLLLAFVAYRRDLPDREDARRISEVAAFVKAQPTAGEISDEELRQHAPLAFDPGGGEFIELFPAGRWNLARFLLHCGEHAWRLRGQQAWFWGSFPTGVTLEYEEEAKLQRGILAKQAALVLSPMVRGQLSIPLADPLQPEFAWWDWMVLVAGPHTPQRAMRPGGLGEFHGSVLETNLDPYKLALSVEHALALKTVAATLLLERERPYPRYIGRLLDVRLPLRLLPLLRSYGIERLLVVVEATGLYASVLDKAEGCIGAAWWEAAPAAEGRCPMNFPAAAWTLLYAVLAAFWKDACANVIVVGPRPPTTTGGAAEAKQAHKRKKKRKRRLYLPPVRTLPAEPASWSDRDDQEHIQRAAQTAHWYRLLPVGWPERAAKADFQRRRALAIQRARSALQPDPPPGFTFVHRLTEEERLGQAAGKPATTVVARGLLALSLVLQEQAIEFATDEEES